MNEPTQQDIQDLKDKADRLGIKYGANTSVEVLLKKVKEKQDSLSGSEESDEEEEAMTKEQLIAVARRNLRNEANKLIRVHITNMNPKKRDLRGEFFTVANEYIGEITKFIPYDPAFYAEGYHVPQAILDLIKNKRFLVIRQEKNRVTGRTKITESWANEFNIAVLPPLTKKELEKLAANQKATGAIDVEENTDSL